MVSEKRKSRRSRISVLEARDDLSAAEHWELSELYMDETSEHLDRSYKWLTVALVGAVANLGVEFARLGGWVRAAIGLGVLVVAVWVSYAVGDSVEDTWRRGRDRARR